MVWLPGNFPIPDGLLPLMNKFFGSSENTSETSSTSTSSDNAHPLPEMPVEILNARLAKCNAINSVYNLLFFKTQMYRRNSFMGRLFTEMSPELRNGVGYADPLPDSLTHGEGLKRIYYDRLNGQKMMLILIKQQLEYDGGDKRLLEVLERLVDMHESEELDVGEECAKMRARLEHIPGWVGGNSNGDNNDDGLSWEDTDLD